MNSIPVGDLEEFAAALLIAGGFNPDHAKDTAKVLVWADARGTVSHGVLRIPRYVEMVETGRLDPEAEVQIQKQDRAVAVLEAANMPGATAMLAASAQAIRVAEQFGIGWCSVRNITHAGANGYYAMQASDRGMVGIVLSASGPLMAYHGARVSGLSTNPISIAVPRNGDPLLLDMSTSTVSLGKVMNARTSGEAIPPEWGIDETGQATTDAKQVKTLTPLGGAKGSGLSFMIEILTSILISNPAISSALKGEGPAMNGMVLVLDISRFTDPDVFARQIVDLVTELKGLPRTKGTDEILMPGERGFILAKERQRSGIPTTKAMTQRLTELADRLNVPCPDGFDQL